MLLVTEQKKAQRMTICNSCPFIIPSTKVFFIAIDKPRCSVCSCVLAWKTSLKNQQCPKGYWT